MQKRCKICSKELGPRQKAYCSNKCKLSDGSLRSKPKPKLEAGRFAVCRKTNKRYRDYLNISGVLSRHLKSIGVEYQNPLDHYDIIIDNTEQPIYQCRYCEWQTKDIKNKSGCVTNHILKAHGMNPAEYIEANPQDSHMWVYSPNKPYHQELLSHDPDSNITCLECGKLMKRITVTHLKLHDMSPEEYRERYGVQILSSTNVRKGMSESYAANFDAINKFITRSKMEDEMCQFLDTLGVTYERGNRSVLKTAELDIYIPDHRLAIEMNGLYWHSERAGKKSRFYHVGKTDRCSQAGVRLVQVFDDEWREKRAIVKSKIKNALNMDSDRIFARSCRVVELDAQTKSSFLKRYHIQGDDRSQFRFGLYKGDALVAVMTFGKNRSALGQKHVDGEYELSRFCSSIRVVGGASKLLRAFIKTNRVTKITTYADARYSSPFGGGLYEALGFKRVSKSKPSYWYTTDYTAKLHRYTYNKRRLIKLFGFPDTMTEFEMADAADLDRVWDCGAYKYELIGQQLEAINK